MYLSVEYIFLIREGLLLKLRAQSFSIENKLKALHTYKNPLLLNRTITDIQHSFSDEDYFPSKCHLLGRNCTSSFKQITSLSQITSTVILIFSTLNHETFIRRIDTLRRSTISRFFLGEEIMKIENHFCTKGKQEYLE